MGELAQIAVGAFAIRVSAIGRGSTDDDLHQRIPKTRSLEQTLAGSSFARDLDRLAAATQRGARAIRGGEATRGVGIRECGQEFVQILQVDVPSRPTES